MLKIWDWGCGKLLREIEVLPTMEPFIAVRPAKRRRGWEEELDTERAGEASTSKLKKSSGRAARRRRQKVEKAKAEIARSETGDEELVEEEQETRGPEEEKVLVIRCIQSMTCHGRWRILFSAIGWVSSFSACHTNFMNDAPSAPQHYVFVTIQQKTIL